MDYSVGWVVRFNVLVHYVQWLWVQFDKSITVHMVSLYIVSEKKFYRFSTIIIILIIAESILICFCITCSMNIENDQPKAVLILDTYTEDLFMNEIFISTNQNQRYFSWNKKSKEKFQLSFFYS